MILLGLTSITCKVDIQCLNIKTRQVNVVKVVDQTLLLNIDKEIKKIVKINRFIVFLVKVACKSVAANPFPIVGTFCVEVMY